MKKIDLLLDKFADITPPEGIVKEVVISAVADVAGVSIGKEQVEVSNDRIRIDVSSTIKSHIHIKKEQILSYIQEQLEEKDITDIR